ncbi:HpcH/HpaI aldolase/citrate lyase family protein [Parvularcula oceani]|uniref:HpcH/HpaI aldolase/citrate lyase family protein n=1 Tax=Parvularcula oceani TaxID=1247963 RepID=UPI0004E2536B|nr:CoA ester lyase [Parvularcula oceani]
MTDPQLWRSLLFVPGARPDRFEKAAAAGADLVCIDLEDAVAPQGKAKAREETLAFLARREGPASVGLRVNAVGSEAGEADLDALKGAEGIAFVMIPKPTGPADLDRVRAAYGKDALIPVLESARAIQAADALADHEAVIGGIYGAIDLAADIGCDLSWEAHLYGRSRCALAFGAARKVLFDVPYLDVKDPDGLEAETRRAKALGIHARSAIHPAQLAPIHTALSPTQDEVARAQRVVEAFEQAEDGVALLDGKMIELPVIKSARRTLALAARQP